MALRTLRAGPRVRRPQLAEGPARDPTCVCGLGERERAGFRLLRILHVHFCERMSVFVKGQVVGGCGGPIKQRSTQKVDGGLRGNNPEDLAEQGAPLFCSNPGSAARIARQPAFTGLNCFSDREPEVRPLELGARGLCLGKWSWAAYRTARCKASSRKWGTLQWCPSGSSRPASRCGRTS